MGFLSHKLKLNEEEFNRFINGESQENIVNDVACRSTHHPAGYGLYSCSILKEGGEFYAKWQSWDSCD